MTGAAPDHAELMARAAWSIVAEPGDAVAGAVIEALGAPQALAWAVRAVDGTPRAALMDLRARLREQSAGPTSVGPATAGSAFAGPATAGSALVGTATARTFAGTPVLTDAATVAARDSSGACSIPASPTAAVPILACVNSVAPNSVVPSSVVPSSVVPNAVLPNTGSGFPESPTPAGAVGPGSAKVTSRAPESPDPRRHDTRWPDSAVRVIARALPRWAPRLTDLEPRRALDVLAEHGGTLVVPSSPDWPAGLGDLGAHAPVCLWVRGTPLLDGLIARSVAVVGARAATPYGEGVAADLGAGLGERRVTVVSGGAFGIDVAAHRGALGVGGATVALLAGGIDRPSPVGNMHVFERLLDTGGALVAESPPGTPPTRSRFLQRNRLIAAATQATVVVEAAWRSGALSTAARAADLLRPLGAVPGPVTSMASAGCHRLLRDGAAVCVTDTDEVVELLGGEDNTDRGVPVMWGSASSAVEAVPRRDAADRADSIRSRVLDAMLRRRALTVVEIARRSGLAEREVMGELGLLELDGAVDRVAGRWRPRPER